MIILFIIEITKKLSTNIEISLQQEKYKSFIENKIWKGLSNR